MSAIAYSVAVALIGASAAVTTQVVVAVDAPVEKRVELASTVAADKSYDFSKFAAAPVEPVSQAERLKPVRVAALGQSQLNVIVRDAALAKRADNLAAAAAEEQNTVILGEEVAVPQFESAALVPLPKTRPSFSVSGNDLTVRRNVVRKKRSLDRPVRVAEATTSPRKRLARRLRSKGWLIGAFR